MKSFKDYYTLPFRANAILLLDSKYKPLAHFLCKDKEVIDKLNGISTKVFNVVLEGSKLKTDVCILTFNKKLLKYHVAEEDIDTVYEELIEYVIKQLSYDPTAEEQNTNDK